MSKVDRNKSKEQMDYLKKVSEDLESIILNTSVPDIKETNKNEMPAISVIKPLNYDNIKNETDEKSEDIVEAVVLLYLPPEFIFEHEYVKQKMSVDKLTVSSLLFQMKTAEHAIKKLLEEIDNGNLHARSFEVLGSLQKSKMEIVKHLAQFMVVLENNYKNLKFDYENAKAENIKTIAPENGVTVQEGSMKFRGTKSLIHALRSAIDNKEEIEEIEEIKKSDEDENKN